MRSSSDLFVFSISFFWYQCCLKNQPLLRGGGVTSTKSRYKKFVFNATSTKGKPIKLIEMECRFVGRIALCESGV